MHKLRFTVGAVMQQVLAVMKEVSYGGTFQTQSGSMAVLFLHLHFSCLT